MVVKMEVGFNELEVPVVVCLCVTGCWVVLAVCAADAVIEEFNVVVTFLVTGVTGDGDVAFVFDVVIAILLTDAAGDEVDTFEDVVLDAKLVDLVVVVVVVDVETTGDDGAAFVAFPLTDTEILDSLVDVGLLAGKIVVVVVVWRRAFGDVVFDTLELFPANDQI